MERELRLEEVVSVLSGETLGVYVLWEDGTSLERIAERIGGSVSDVQRHLFLAERRLQEYKTYLRIQESAERKVEFPLTYWELQEIEAALRQQEERLFRKWICNDVEAKESVFLRRVKRIRMLAARAGVVVFDEMLPEDELLED